MAANVSAVSRLRSCSGRRHQQGPRRVHQLWRRGVRAQRAPRESNKRMPNIITEACAGKCLTLSSSPRKKQNSLWFFLRVMEFMMNMMIFKECQVKTTMHLDHVELRSATPIAGTPRPSRNEADEDDEPPLNEEEDDELDDFDQEDNETNNQHLVLVLFKKVTRTKSRWKCTLKDRIMHLKNRDILFNKWPDGFSVILPFSFNSQVLGPCNICSCVLKQ